MILVAQLKGAIKCSKRSRKRRIVKSYNHLHLSFPSSHSIVAGPCIPKGMLRSIHSLHYASSSNPPPSTAAPYSRSPSYTPSSRAHQIDLCKHVHQFLSISLNQPPLHIFTSSTIYILSPHPTSLEIGHAWLTEASPYRRRFTNTNTFPHH